MAQYIPGTSVTLSASMHALANAPLPDDTDVQTRVPQICVDYLSHDWAEEDVWASWRSMTRHKNEITNGVRLENASWRTWWKQRNKLRTISPETLNWLKDSDVTWLYGPLHTAAEPVPPPKVSTAEERLNLEKSSGKKPILKHRTITEILSVPSPASPASELMLVEYEVPERPPLPHLKSDPTILRSALRRESPPRAPNGVEHAELARARSRTQMSDSGLSDSSGQMEGSAQKRHISFNTFVEQCISIERPIAKTSFGHMLDDDDDEPEDMLEFRSSSSSSRASSSSSRPSMGRRGSSFDRDHITIAPIAPTILKTSGSFPAPSPAVVFVPPEGVMFDNPYMQASMPVGNGVYPGPGRSLYAPPATGFGWDDVEGDYGVGFDYFSAPDFGVGDEYNTVGPGLHARASSRGGGVPVSSAPAYGAYQQKSGQKAYRKAPGAVVDDDDLVHVVVTRKSRPSSSSPPSSPPSSKSRRVEVVVEAGSQRVQAPAAPVAASAPVAGRSILKNPIVESVPERRRSPSSLSPPSGERGRSYVRTPPIIAERERSASKGSSPLGSVSPNSRGTIRTSGSRRASSTSPPSGMNGNTVGPRTSSRSTVPKPVGNGIIAAAQQQQAQLPFRPTIVINHEPSIQTPGASSGGSPQSFPSPGLLDSEDPRKQDDYWSDKFDATTAGQSASFQLGDLAVALSGPGSASASAPVPAPAATTSTSFFESGATASTSTAPRHSTPDLGGGGGINDGSRGATGSAAGSARSAAGGSVGHGNSNGTSSRNGSRHGGGDDKEKVRSGPITPSSSLLTKWPSTASLPPPPPHPSSSSSSSLPPTSTAPAAECANVVVATSSRTPSLKRVAPTTTTTSTSAVTACGSATHEEGGTLVGRAVDMVSSARGLLGAIWNTG